MTYSHVRYAATGLVKEMRDDVRIVYGPSVNPSESRARHTLAATFLVTFAVLFAAALPAQAQTTIWSATLTPRTTFSGDPVPLGCDNTSTGNRRCSNSNTLSDDFTDDGTTYAVTKFFTRDGVLTFRLDMSATAATQGLTLVIDGEEFVLMEADQINGGKTQWKWNNTTLGWTAGTGVAVSLVVTDAPPTGQPTISGGGQVGKTLTAATDDIEDPDALPTTPTFTYQWVRVDGFTDTDIPGAASETYTLTASDLGKQIKVTVSFTDFRGHAEGPLTSDAYPPNNGTVVAAAGPCPAVNDWCGTVTVARDGDAFGYDYEKFGSLDDYQIEYRGQNINVWTVHTQKELTNEYFYFGSMPRVPRGTVVTVGEHTFTTDMESEDGSTADIWEFPLGELPPDLVWSDGLEVRISLVLGNFPAEGAGTVWISGTAKRGQTLTAHVSDVSDPDGLTSPSYAYQWVRVDDTKTDIAGATAGTYRLVAADVGKKVEVRISFTDDRGNAETLTSDAAYPLSGTIEHAPVFGGTHGTRHLAETVGAATVQTAADIGTPVAATDDLANEPLTYSLQGTDADKFTFVSSSGQIRTKVDERYDYETDPSYEVTVRADNANGAWATIDVTINITNNTNEQSLAPTALMVAATIGSTMSLDVSWTAPDNTGRPAITSYDLRYQKVTATAWTDGPQDVTGTSASIMGLDPGTQYRVAVRATNDDGDGAWSSTSAGDGQRSPDPAVGRTTLPVVRFGSAAYTAIEGVQDATVTVELNPATERSVTILLTATPQGGATASDFSGMPSSVTFAPGETQKTFTVIATDDNVDDDGESVRLGFGRLPSSVEGGSPSTATVVLVQDADVSDLVCVVRRIRLYGHRGQHGADKPAPERPLEARPQRGADGAAVHARASRRRVRGRLLRRAVERDVPAGADPGVVYGAGDGRQRRRRRRERAPAVPSPVSGRPGGGPLRTEIRHAAYRRQRRREGGDGVVRGRELHGGRRRRGGDGAAAAGRGTGPRGDDSADAEQPRGHGGRLFRPADERDLRGVGNGAELYPHRDGRQRRRRSGERGDRLRVAPRAGVGGQPVRDGGATD